MRGELWFWNEQSGQVFGKDYRLSCFGLSACLLVCLPSAASTMRHAQLQRKLLHCPKVPHACSGEQVDNHRSGRHLGDLTYSPRALKGKHSTLLDAATPP